MPSFLEQIDACRQKMPLSNQSNLVKQAVEEGLIRRIAELRLPMMLKGSYISRQYLSEQYRPYRIPADLDWFGLKPLDQEMVNKWMIAATNHQLYTGNDGLYFRDFRENCFWRMIDYAMADDFPTINTDLLVYLTDKKTAANSYEIDYMDISFNLELASPPIALNYQPLLGEPFTIPYTCPFDIQIAWKLHQCIVHPRLKDIVDIIWLLQSYFDVNWPVVAQSIREECRRDNPRNAHPDRLKLLLNGELAGHPNWGKRDDEQLENRWKVWRNVDYDTYLKRPYFIGYQDVMVKSFAENSPIPYDLKELLDELHETLTLAGFNELLTAFGCNNR